MDDARIDAIAREVLGSLKKDRSETSLPAHGSATSASAIHPSLQLLSVKGGVVGSPCVIEPDAVCIGSLRCRSFGH